AAALGVPDLAVHLLERLRHGREQILDRLPARVDVAGRLGACFAQARFGQREERLVVGVEGVSTERLERVAQLGFGVVVRLQPLGVDGAILLELGSKTGPCGPGREPANHRADSETQSEREDEGGKSDGHQYRFLRSNQPERRRKAGHDRDTSYRDTSYRDTPYRDTSYRDTTNGSHASGSWISAACIAAPIACATTAGASRRAFRPAAICCSARRAAICAWRRLSTYWLTPSSAAVRSADRATFSISSRPRLTRSKGNCDWKRAADAVFRSPAACSARSRSRSTR